MSLGHAFRDLAAQSLALFSTRLELFSLEALQVRDQWLCRLAALLASAIFLLLALLVATVAFALWVWPDEHRYQALAWLALLYAVFGGGIALWLVHRVRHDPAPFEATLDVLGDDARALRARHPMPGASPEGAGDSSRSAPDETTP